MSAPCMQALIHIILLEDHISVCNAYMCVWFVNITCVGESCISPALILAGSHDKSYNVLPPIPPKVQVLHLIILFMSFLTSLFTCVSTPGSFQEA